LYWRLSICYSCWFLYLNWLFSYCLRAISHCSWKTGNVWWFLSLANWFLIRSWVIHKAIDFALVLISSLYIFRLTWYACSLFFRLFFIWRGKGWYLLRGLLSYFRKLLISNWSTGFTLTLKSLEINYFLRDNFWTF